MSPNNFGAVTLDKAKKGIFFHFFIEVVQLFGLIAMLWPALWPNFGVFVFASTVRLATMVGDCLILNIYDL